MVCVTCVLIEKLVPARPPKSLTGLRQTSPNGDRQTLPNGDGLVPRGCFAAKNIILCCDKGELLRALRSLGFNPLKSDIQVKRFLS